MSTDLQFASEYRVNDLSIVTPDGKSLFVQDYLVELNIFEDIFANFLTGKLILSDSANMIGTLPVKGVETLLVDIVTPTMNKSIKKAFQIYGVANRTFTRDQNTQVYELSFCSKEGYLNGAKYLYKQYKGTPSQIIQSIYDEELKIDTDLVVFDNSKNQVKFVANGKNPYTVINWLNSKAQPTVGEACSFLFYETTQKAYLTTVETLVRNKTQLLPGKFVYSPAGTKESGDTPTKMFRIETMAMVRETDHIVSQLTGHLNSRFITIDPVKKQYEVKDYDHVDEWLKYAHLSFDPLHDDSLPRNFDSARKVYPRHPGLFKDSQDNINEVLKDIFGNRVSNLAELDNFKMNIVIPGRTNIEVGHAVELVFPKSGPTDNTDKSGTAKDELFSGFYLVTALRHKFNPLNHSCSLEIMRDSIGT
jgi:hypothetical protein